MMWTIFRTDPVSVEQSTDRIWEGIWIEIRPQLEPETWVDSLLFYFSHKWKFILVFGFYNRDFTIEQLTLSYLLTLLADNNIHRKKYKIFCCFS